MGTSILQVMQDTLLDGQWHRKKWLRDSGTESCHSSRFRCPEDWHKRVQSKTFHERWKMKNQRTQFGNFSSTWRRHNLVSWPSFRCQQSSGCGINVRDAVRHDTDRRRMALAKNGQHGCYCLLHGLIQTGRLKCLSETDSTAGGGYMIWEDRMRFSQGHRRWCWSSAGEKPCELIQDSKSELDEET